jgi:copper chaperone NosL
MNKGIGEPDAGARRRGVATLLSLTFFLLPLALTSCTASRPSVVSADATTGYCAVCKMKVNAADPWASEIHFSDGTKLMFETPGDMVTFYSAPEKYEVPDAQKNRANITSIVVKDYQTRQFLDARQASLVYKSRIESDMGPDFVPLATREAAERFVAANGGAIVALSEVTPEMVQNLRKK